MNKTFGLYLSVVLIVLLFSGIYIIFKPQLQSLMGLFSRVREEPKDLESTPIPSQPPLGLDAAAAIADRIFPDGKVHWIFLPQGREGVYVVGKQRMTSLTGGARIGMSPSINTAGTSFMCWTGQNPPRARHFSMAISAPKSDKKAPVLQ